MQPIRRYLTKEDLHSASNLVETLCNLNYLICEESERPDKVRDYATLSDERLRILSVLLLAAQD
jgi:hypothetical protein